MEDRTRPPGIMQLARRALRPQIRRVHGTGAMLEERVLYPAAEFRFEPSGGDCRPARLGREPQFQRSAYGRLVATPPAESRRASRSGEYRTTPAIGRNGTG